MATQQQVTTNEKIFKDFVKRITTALNIDNTNADKLSNELFTKFGKEDQYKLLTNQDITQLLKADESIKELESKMSPYFKDVQNNWKSLINNLGKLQALIFIKKLEEPTPDCAGIINEIVTALNNKISTVNTILENNIKISEKATQSKQKYLKYKSKYLHLKNNM
jgi:hypothetical protein